MKLQIEQLDSGYTLDVCADGVVPERYAFQSAHSLLLTIIDQLSCKDDVLQHVGLKQKCDARYVSIVKVLRLSGKAMTVNEIAIQTAEQMGKTWTEHFQKGILVALANGVDRPRKDGSLLERVAPGVYRYRPEEVEP